MPLLSNKYFWTRQRESISAKTSVKLKPQTFSPGNLSTSMVHYSNHFWALYKTSTHVATDVQTIGMPRVTPFIIIILSRLIIIWLDNCNLWLTCCNCKIIIIALKFMEENLYLKTSLKIIALKMFDYTVWTACGHTSATISVPKF